MNRLATKTLSKLRVLCAVICTLMLTVGCQPQQSEQLAVTLPVVFSANKEVIGCDQSINIVGQSWRINQLAFYVSSAMVKTAKSAEWQPIRFIENDWQTADTSLVWFNNDCRNTPTSFNHQLVIDDAQGLWQAATEFKFELAVPFTQNHQNPLTQPSPLNLSEMFWSWQLGHKFIRLDLAFDDSQANEQGVKPNMQNDSWSFHLGSLGCDSASSMRAPTNPCNTPNRFDMSMSRSADQNALIFDLTALLNAVQPAQMRSCMFQGVDELACPLLLNNLTNNSVFSLTTDASSNTFKDN